MAVQDDQTGAARKPLGEIIVELTERCAGEAGRMMTRDNDVTRNTAIIKASMLELVVLLMQELDNEAEAESGP